MLVLSRKENETIIIDGKIRVTVVQCGRGRVKVAIQAPDEVSILRGELAVDKDASTAFPAYHAVGDPDVLAYDAVSAGA